VLSVDQGSGMPADVSPLDGMEMLRQSLHVAAGEVVSVSKIRLAIRMTCADAHRLGLPAEKLLIQFKEIWRTLPEIPSDRTGRPNTELLRQIISMFIQEYYLGSDTDTK
jgi:hypothetical protein